MICSLSVTGWETYIPAYFESPSKEEFEKAVSEAIKTVIPSLEKDEGFIDGRDLQNGVMPILCEKFKYLGIEHEVDIGGECLYSDNHQDRPKIIDDESWRRILEHNDKVHKELYKDLEPYKDLEKGE